MQSRNPPCTLLFLAPFANGFPFSVVSHRTIYTIPSFRAQREIFLALCSFLLLSQKVSPSLLSHIRRYTGLQERSLDFARDDVAEVAFSQHTLYTGRGLSIPHTVSLAASPQSPTTKKPQPKLELFCVRKTYLPNCASMVPAATAVPITPATFGPIACISR